MNLPAAVLPRRQAGLSYLEVLVATVVIAISLVPAIEALTTGIQGSAISEELTVQHYHLLAKMEEVLAEPYGQLKSAALAAASKSVATSYSDTGGTANRRIVYLSEYDGDNVDADNDPFTGIDSNLLWVRVEIENSAQYLESLTTP